MVKLALAVVAAVLLHVVPFGLGRRLGQPMRLEVEIKPKVSNGQEELDLGSSSSEQPLSSGSMHLEGDKKPKPINTKAQRQGWYKYSGW